MPTDPNVTSLAHVIQSAVAPVFLLSGIGSMLAVMTNRLSRVIDRARTLEEKIAMDSGDHVSIKEELAVLHCRARLVNRAVTLCTLTAILICMVIVILFLDSFLPFGTSIPVAVLFIVAMLTFIIGLTNFLREILLATSKLRIGPPGSSMTQTGK